MALNYSGDLASARTLAFVRRYGMREHPELKKCRLETLRNRKDATMMTAPEEAAFLAFFIQAIGARRGLEIGVFTGYSSLALALALPADGKLVACEVDPEAARIAGEHWKAAGVANKVVVHVGDAVATVERFIAAGESNSYDFAYIDANKEQYDTYYEACLKLVRVGGHIIIDNMLWGGKVADSGDTDASTAALRALNEKIHKDERVDVVLSTMGDGVTFARRR